LFTPQSKEKHKSIMGKLTPVSRSNYKEFLHTSKQTVQVPVSRSIYKDPLAQTAEQTRTAKALPPGSKQRTKQNDPQNPEQSDRLEESQQPSSSVIDPKCDEILKQAQQEVLKFSKSQPLQNQTTQDGKPLAVKVNPTQQLVDHVKTGSSEIRSNTTIVYVSRKRFKINDLPLEERAQWRRFFEAVVLDYINMGPEPLVPTGKGRRETVDHRPLNALIDNRYVMLFGADAPSLTNLQRETVRNCMSKAMIILLGTTAMPQLQ